MRKTALAVILCVVVTGCATTPSGEDPRGKELKAQATTVLVALIAYHQDHGIYPASLQELAPGYLPNVPFDPGLVLDSQSGTVSFRYPAPFPKNTSVVCVAKLGATEWKCSG